MITPQELTKIKGTVQEFFQKMGFPVEVEARTLKEKTVPLNIKTEDPKALIGERGSLLLSIERLLRIITRKKIDKEFYLNLDVNGYKEKKTDYLRQLAKSVADDVSLSKEEKVLPPMLPYERRIVHLELADRENIITKSVDRGAKRRIIVKPYP
jgi:spoIIIJ-associated protein